MESKAGAAFDEIQLQSYCLSSDEMLPFKLKNYCICKQWLLHRAGSLQSVMCYLKADMDSGNTEALKLAVASKGFRQQTS